MYEDKDLYIVDFSDVSDYGDMHAAIKKGLDFSDDYKENGESFFECLTDMSDVGLNFIFRGIEVLKALFPESATRLIKYLKEYKRKNEYGYCITVKIEDGDEGYYLN